MNKIIKYALYIFIAMAFTCAVVFLPYMYYASTDKKTEEDYVTETFLLDKARDTLTSSELVKLLSSDEAVWLESNKSVDFNNSVLDDVSHAMLSLSSGFQNNKYALAAFDKFYDATSWLFLSKVDEIIVNGKIDNSPVSVTLLYILFESSDEYNRGNYSILIDKKTNIVYEFSCAPYGGVVTDEFFETHDIYEQMETAFYELTCLNLKSYWKSENSQDINVITAKDHFYFNIMPISFTSYAFNNYSSVMDSFNESMS